jgi:hypothetical protein
MKHAAASIGALAVTAILAQACQGFPDVREGKRLVVTLAQGNPGTQDQPRAISVAQPTPATTFTVDIEAHLPDGTIDTSFNGYVNVSVQPGTVFDLNVRNVQLQNGAIRGVVVPTVAAFGQAHIWADDVGYQPAAPNRQPPPQCSDGIDNNNNGLIDYPADPGCYAPVDDTEDLGSYASGASETLYFQLPRIPLVRGYDPANNGNGNATLFPHSQVDIDTGWRGGKSYAFSTVIIGLTSAGFYAQDLQGDLSPAPGYSGIYAYNFSTPAFMRVCDRLQQLSGTADDFYGFTELNYPTWQLEYWDPKVRPCLVPEPTVLGVGDINNDNRLWQLEATLVRLLSAGGISFHVAKDFGPGNVPIVGGVYTPGPDTSNCDYDHNGKINYTDQSSTPSEASCAAACNGTSSLAPTDYECSEFSQFLAQNDFEVVVDDVENACTQQSDCTGNYLCSNGHCSAHARMQVNAAAANSFNALSERGNTLVAFTGLLSYFSGGTQFTVNARCDDDIITGHDPNNMVPKTSDQACVHPWSQADLNAATGQ